MAIVYQNLLSRSESVEGIMVPLLSRATHKVVFQNFLSRAESQSLVFANLLSRARSYEKDVLENLLMSES